jgi:hypothetical protein
MLPTLIATPPAQTPRNDLRDVYQEANPEIKPVMNIDEISRLYPFPLNAAWRLSSC